MRKICVCIVVVGMLAVAASAKGDAVTFTLLTHADNKMLLPQPKGLVGVSGDHLLRTPDDITGSTFNPEGAFTFNFMNPAGEALPDYPPGYAEGIHSMTGSVTLDVDLLLGGSLGVSTLAFDGYITATKTAYQRLTAGGHPNDGSYAATADANWAFTTTIDWCYDTPYPLNPPMDMTFDDYAWNGFIMPVAELDAAGMAAVVLEDPLGYFGGTSEDFESWLLTELVPRLPGNAAYLLFAQGEAHPDWTQTPGMTTDGIVAETIIAYAIPEPATMATFLAGLMYLLARKSRRNR